MLTDTAVACEHVVEHLPADAVDSELDSQLVDLLSYCFTGLDRVRLRHRQCMYTLPADRWVMRDGRDRLIAHLAGREIVVDVDQSPHRVAGVSDVCVHPSYREQGRMKRLLGAVHRWARQRDLPFAVLFGQTELYESSGYQRIDNPIRRWDADLAAWTESPMRRAMIKRLSGVSFPQGVIDLRGPVF